jgi:peptidoglycan/LPS O-acetylase OafA/YrhL
MGQRRVFDSVRTLSHNLRMQVEQERGPRPLPALTGVRAVAAFAVLVSHLRLVLPDPVVTNLNGHEGSLWPWISSGALGVPLFFVLSGFILTWSHLRATSTTTFWWRRFARVWPAYIVVWMAFAVCAGAGIGAQLGLRPTVSSFLLLQCWIPGLGDANAVNPVGWTLSCEAFFYLVFPVLIGPITRMRAGVMVLGAASCVAFGAILHVVLLEPRGITVSTFPPFRLWEFVLGMLAGSAAARGMVRAPRVGVPLVAIVLTWVVYLHVPAIRSVAGFVPPVAFAMLITRLALEDLQGRRSLLRSRLFIHGGEISYCFYLVQLLPLFVWRHFVHISATWRSGPVLAVAWLLATIALAELLHSKVERPAAAMLRRRDPTGRPSVPSAA